MMHYYKKIFFLSLAIFFTAQSFAQKSKIDSLILEVKKNKTDIKKTNILLEISLEYTNIGLYDSSLVYAQQAKELAEKSNNKILIASAIEKIGYNYRLKGNFTNALSFYFNALKKYDEDQNFIGISSVKLKIGNVYSYQGDYTLALKYLNDALLINEKLQNKSGVASTLGNIGNVYYFKTDYSEALKYYSEALRINTEIGNENEIANNHVQLGLIYHQMHDFEKALENYLFGLDIYRKQNKQSHIPLTLGNIGLLYCEMGNFNKAEGFLKDALSIDISIGSLNGQKYRHESLYQLYEKTGKFQLALEHYKKYSVIKDSIFNEENTKSQVQIEMTYKFEKKEALTKAENDKEQALAREQIKKQKIVIYSSVVGGVLLLSLLTLAGYAYRQKQKANKSLAEKNIFIEQQKKHIEEKHKETTDSITYAKRLQHAILPPSELIKRHLPDSFILYKPKDIVAGDFYWMEHIDNFVFIAVADCTGHGVPGAMVSVVCSNALNRAVKEFGLRETGKILDKVTDLVIETFEKSDSVVQDGMDISLLSYNTTTKQVHWSGANNPLWFIDNKTIKEIKADKQPIGKYDKHSLFSTHNIDFSDQTTFYLFTDGFADQFGGVKEKKYTYKRLRENILTISDLTMEEQHKKLEQAFEEWKGTTEQIDDVTIIGIKMQPDKLSRQ